MTFPRWRQSLARSLHLSRSKPEAKFFQVANAYLSSAAGSDEAGSIVVENRTMVHRGFVDNSQILLAITDTRSDKVTGWQQSSSAQLCWYFTKSREQYRISASVSLIGNDGFISEDENKTLIDSAQASAIRAKVWLNLSEKAKAQFFWPTPKQPLLDETRSADSEDAADSIPSTFCLVCFTPYHVDYLNLTTQPQTRELHELLDEKWTYSLVNA